MNTAVSPVSASLISKKHKEYFKKNPEALKRSSAALEEYPSFLRRPAGKALGAMPLPLLEFILAGSFAEGTNQSIQEFFMQLIPKFLTGLAIRGSLAMGVHEAFVEIPEWFALYYWLSLAGLGFAKASAPIVGINHFELLGKRSYELEKLIGKKITVGTVRPKEILFNKEMYRRACFAKSFNAIGVAAVVIAMEIIAASVRVLLTKHFMKTSNFYKISGLKVNGKQNGDGDAAVKQAKKNIKKCFEAILLAIPITLGLIFGLYKTGAYKSPIFERLSKTFDLGDKFGLSRILLLATIIPGAGYGYNTTALNLAEAKENLFRMETFSWPCILFYKPVLGTIIAGLTGLAIAKGNIIGNPVKTWSKEIKTGERDPLYLGFADIKKNKDGTYSGKIPERIKEKFPNLNEAKREKLFKYAHIGKEYLPTYAFALPVGFLVAYYNYKRTVRLYNAETKQQQDSKKNSAKKDKDKSPVMNWIEGIISRQAEYLYNIQQKNANNFGVKAI